MKHCLALILCLAFLSSAPAFAQQPGDPASKEDVQRLFDAMRVRKQLDAVMELVKKQLPTLSNAAMDKQMPNATPEQKAMLDQLAIQQIQKMYEKLPLDELMQAVLPVYRQHFTHGEIQEITRFYSSPAGQKLLSQMPTITLESLKAAAPILQQWVIVEGAEIKASADEYSNKLKELNPQPQKKKTPPASLNQPLR